MRRRALLAALGMAIFVVPGAAWFVSSRPDPSAVAELEIVNYDDRPHAVEVRMHEDGTVLYERSLELAATSSAGPSGSPTRGVERDLIGYPTDPGTYTISAWIADGASDSRASFDIGAYDASCVALRVHIGAPERPTADVSIWHATDPDDC